MKSLMPLLVHVRKRSPKHAVIWISSNHVLHIQNKFYIFERNFLRCSKLSSFRENYINHTFTFVAVNVYRKKRPNKISINTHICKIMCTDRLYTPAFLCNHIRLHAKCTMVQDYDLYIAAIWDHVEIDLGNTRLIFLFICVSSTKIISAHVREIRPSTEPFFFRFRCVNQAVDAPP